MSDRQDIAFATWKESSRKLDYFMSGLLAALVAYVAKDFEAQRFTAQFSAYYIEVLAIIILLAALGVALKRLENVMCGACQRF